MSEGRSRGWLRYPADRRTLGLAAAWFAVLAVHGLALPGSLLDLLPAPLGRPEVASGWRWPLGLVSATLLSASCLLAFVGAVAAHNAMHCPMFRSRRANDAWRLVHTLWYGQPVSLFVPVHNHSHHRFAQTRRDLTRTTVARGSWQVLNLLRGTRWQRAALRTSIRYFGALRARGSGAWRAPLVEAAVLLGAHAVLASADWRRWLVVVVVPHTVGRFCIKAINFLQHDGCAYDPHGHDHSRNFTGSWFNWWFLNNGFHTIHHARPGLHWSLLRARHDEVVRPHLHPALDVPSALPFLWRFLVWPGRRERFDGGPWEDQPGGEGPDLPWSLDEDGAADAFGALRRAG